MQDSCYVFGFACLCVNFMVPTFSDWQISLTFPVFFTVFQYFLKFIFLFKVWYHICRVFTITGWQISLTFPVFFSIFQCNFFPIFPVFWVKFLDFFSLDKIPWLFPDWKMPFRFSRFSLISSPSGNNVSAVS